MGLRYRITIDDAEKLIQTKENFCVLNKTESKECLNCHNCLGMQTVLGTPKVIFCKGEKIEKDNEILATLDIIH